MSIMCKNTGIYIAVLLHKFKFGILCGLNFILLKLFLCGLNLISHGLDLISFQLILYGLNLISHKLISHANN